MWGFPSDRDDYKWVDDFLASEPLGKLFVRVDRASEKGDANSHYRETKTDDDRFDDPEDPTVKSYGADQAQYLANEPQSGPDKAFELVTRVTGRFEGVRWYSKEAFEEYSEKIERDIILEPREVGTYELLEPTSKGKKQVTASEPKATAAACFRVIPYKAENDKWESGYFAYDEYAPTKMAKIEEYLPLLATSKGETPLFKALLRRDYYPACPRIRCEGQRCLPVGALDKNRKTKFMLFYCPRCNDFYRPSDPILRRTPGSFFHANPKKTANQEVSDPYFFRTAKILHEKGLVGKMETYEPKIFGIPMMPKRPAQSEQPASPATDTK